MILVCSACFSWNLFPKLWVPPTGDLRCPAFFMPCEACDQGWSVTDNLFYLAEEMGSLMGFGVTGQ